jgi:predicted enzyme related to lactoylglutathione lyase
MEKITMTKLIGPDFVALMVRDLETSRRFYTEKVGLSPTPDSPPHAVVFQTEPIPFAIRTPALDLNESSHLGWGVALWFKCEDANGLYASLLTNGVKIAQPIFDGPFGRTFSFIDPDGYELTVHGG